MKLRFFTNGSSAFISNDDLEEVAGLSFSTIEHVKQPSAFYEELWPVYAKSPLSEYLERKGLSMEDFTEVDSYGKPLQDAA